MTPLAATASAAPLLLSLLGTAVLLCFVMRTAMSQARKLWKALRGLAPRATALLGVALLVLFVQIGGSLQAGKVMISTKQDADKTTAYHTTAITTLDGRRAQHSDAQVTVSAYIKPVPPEGFPMPTVYFGS